MQKIAFSLIALLLLAACSNGTVTRGGPNSDTPGEVAVDFFQDGESVGSLFVRAGAAQNNLVPFFVEIPYVDHDHRLKSLTLEFRSDAVAPAISLQASSGSLTENIAFTRDFDGPDAIVRPAIESRIVCPARTAHGSKHRHQVRGKQIEHLGEQKGV